MNDIRAQIASLSPEQRKRFLQRLQQEVQPAPARIQNIPRRADPTQVPLSFGQQGMWLLDQLEPGNPLYTLTPTMRLTGPLDVAALAHSLNAIIARHEVLRARFPVVDGQPVQVIAPQLRIPLPLTDLRDLAPAARTTLAHALLDDVITYHFDLAAGPLVCARLLRLADDEHILTVMMHHIVTDGWSLGVLIQELVALYGAQTSNRPPPLPALPIQYADFTAWQRARMQGAFLEAQLGYWRQHLAEVPVLQLPTDYARPAVQQYRSANLPVALAPALTSGLKALSRRTGTTLFMAQFVIFATLLGRLSGQTDFCVGTLVAGRTQPELEGLLGCFVNTLALRVDLRGQPSAEALLRQVRAVTLGAYDHQDVPFELVLAALPATRTASHTPLFQTMCVMQNFPRPQQVLPGLMLQPLSTASRRAGFDLTFVCWEEPEGLAGELEYNPTLFAPATIRRIGGQLRTLLTHVVATPERPLSALPLLSAAERHQLLGEWNDTATTVPADACLQTLFERQVARTPDGIAAVGAEQHLSYATLNARANQLAHYLRALGAGPETRVGLCLARSPALIVGILGILKAGAAYVPLDPTHPQERRAFMLEDSQAKVLIIATEAPRGRGSGVGGQDGAILVPDARPRTPEPWSVVDLVVDAPMIARQPTANPPAQTRPDHLAYLIYTSGTTGRPKAVLVEQHNLAHVLCASQRQFQFSARDVLPWIAPAVFDIALFELFNPLLVGGTTVVLTSDEVLDLPRLLAVLMRCTALHSVPGLMQQIVRAIAASPQGPPAYDQMRMIFVGGELVPPALVAQMQATFRRAAITVLYGPTEGTIISTHYRVPRGQPTERPLIGRPLANVQTRLTDRQGQPVPIGIAGELRLAGAGVTRGYWQRAELTHEKYVTAEGQRWYRTGDLARYHADGQIEFLGRLDEQIKLRGYRIEPGEIATVLRSHADVRECVVSVSEDAPGMQRLVAYVVPTEDERRRTQDDRRGTIDHAPTTVVLRRSSLVSELRAFLAARLPDYMIPSAFVLLDALPLTPTGKLDRRALPTPATRLPDEQLVAPRTPIEEVLAGIWVEVLGVAQVGVEDNFFTLGGYSLLATQVIARIRDVFQIELPLRTLFEAPTVAGLAAQLARSQRANAGLLAPPLQPAVRSGLLPLSFAQQRLWFLDQFAPGSANYSIPTPVRLTGALDRAALHASFCALVRRHETLRTTFRLVDGQPAQVIALPAALLLPHVDLGALPPTEREAVAQRLVRAEARQPFDLARGPLVRTTLLEIDAQTHMLLITMHHIISDGWSVGVLIRDLAALYAAATSRQPAPLPDLPIQYADYASWQQAWLQGDVRDAQLNYWTRQLAGAPPMLDLPLDRPRPLVQTFRGAQQQVIVPAPLMGALQALSQREGVTLFMTLLANWQMLLARYSGQDDIVVGSPIANRTQRATERLIGFFVNTLVLRTDLRGNPSFLALLQRVRSVCLGAYAHQDLPFEQLVDVLQPVRDLGRHPLFQVMFIVQNAPMPALDVPGLTLRPVPVETQIANFDLTLSVTESAAGLVATWEYNTDLFDAPTILRLAGHLQALLAGTVAEPARPIAALSLLRVAEQQQLLVEWNATAAAYPPDDCAHQLIEAQAARTPDVIALVFDETHDEWRRMEDEGSDSAFVARPSSLVQLTYAELNRRANQLAHHLRTLGVGPEALVGLALPRSLDLLVGIFGILKAGGAYLPLDPAYPTERLAFMLADSQARVLITTKDEGRAQPIVVRRSSFIGNVVDLGADWPQIAQRPTTNPANDVTPDQLAYVIYTSGSLGTPKGVAITHRALVNHTSSAVARFALGPADRVLQFASLSFDTAAEEIYPTLTRGATLVLRNDAFLGPAAQVLATCHALGLTVLDLPTAYWHQLTAEIAAQRLELPDALRLVIIGGEAALPELIARWQACAGARVRLVNTYGPTEATIAATSWALPAAADAFIRHYAPIGHPIANTQVYVLDTQQHPVPIGVPGELYIGGAGLARGYLGRPDLTAERFIPSPFLATKDERRTTNDDRATDDQPVVRLYKTGDRARLRADGTLDFLGRVDQQVKIRGFRVEPGEIETVLGQHPALRAVAVVARDAAPGDTRLVAYVVLGEDERRTANGEEADSSIVLHPSSVGQEVRAFLAERLPEHLLPAAVVVLDALPLTPSGKVDHAALLSPDWSQCMLAESYAAPRTPTEATVAGVAAQVLGVARVGIHDNFFTLGGHSLLIVRLLARIEQQFGQRIPLATLFQNPTVAHLAHSLRQQTGALAHSPLVGLQPAGAQRPFFCVHPGAGNVLCYLELAHSLGHTQPFYGLQAAGLAGEPPRRTIADMAAAYLAALRAVQPQGPYVLGGWSFGGLVAFEMAQQLHVQGQTVALLALIDSVPPAPDAAPPSDDLALLAGFADDLGRLFGKTTQLTIADLRGIAPEQRLGYVLAQARAAQALPPDIDETQVRRALAVFAANTEAMQRYQPQPYSGRATLFRASAQALAGDADPTLGWGALTTDGVAVHVMPGDHYSMIRPPHVQVLAERLRACLEAAQADDVTNRVDQSQPVASIQSR
jgi:amino acid adenylation domain-containing protein